jgi:hypothetical protein
VFELCKRELEHKNVIKATETERESRIAELNQRKVALLAVQAARIAVKHSEKRQHQHQQKQKLSDQLTRQQQASCLSPRRSRQNHQGEGGGSMIETRKENKTKRRKKKKTGRQGGGNALQRRVCSPPLTSDGGEGEEGEESWSRRKGSSANFSDSEDDNAVEDEDEDEDEDGEGDEDEDGERGGWSSMVVTGGMAGAAGGLEDRTSYLRERLQVE